MLKTTHLLPALKASPPSGAEKRMACKRIRVRGQRQNRGETCDRILMAEAWKGLSVAANAADCDATPYCLADRASTACWIRHRTHSVAYLSTACPWWVASPYRCRFRAMSAASEASLTVRISLRSVGGARATALPGRSSTAASKCLPSISNSRARSTAAVARDCIRDSISPFCPTACSSNRSADDFLPSRR